MSLILGKLAMNAGGVQGQSPTGSWHRCTDMPFTPSTQGTNSIAVMNVGGRYLIYMAHVNASNVVELWEYNPYLDTWTQRSTFVSSSNTSVTDSYSGMVAVGTKLYYFRAKAGGNGGGLGVVVWDQPTDHWTTPTGTIDLLPDNTYTDIRWIHAVYLPGDDPDVIRVWFSNLKAAVTSWFYYQYRISTHTWTQQPATGLLDDGSPTGASFTGFWADTLHSPSHSYTQHWSGNVIRRATRMTWSATAASAESAFVDTPVDENLLRYDGTREASVVRIGVEYDQEGPGNSLAVTNAWSRDPLGSHGSDYANWDTIPSGLKVLTAAGQTYWLGADWALVPQSSHPVASNPTSPWASYLPALGQSAFWDWPAAGAPLQNYGQGLRNTAILYAAGCLFMFGGNWFGHLDGTGLSGPQRFTLRYGDISLGGALY